MVFPIRNPEDITFLVFTTFFLRAFREEQEFNAVMKSAGIIRQVFIIFID